MSTELLVPAPIVAQISGNPGDIRGMALPDISSTSVSRADGTSTPRQHRLRTHPIGPSLKKDVAILKASGMGTRVVAKVLGKNARTINRVLALPEVQGDIAELRQTWKTVAQAQVTQLAHGAWTMASSFVEQRDARAFDNTLRGLVAMEKISQSVSGEGQKVEVTGQLVGPPLVELKALVCQLFGAEGN